MHKLLARRRGLRLDPLKVDWALAALLTVVTQVAIWLAATPPTIASALLWSR